MLQQENRVVLRYLGTQIKLHESVLFDDIEDVDLSVQFFVANIIKSEQFLIFCSLLLGELSFEAPAVKAVLGQAQ